MFDLATQPHNAPIPGAALALPFDWRLTAPTGLVNYPFTDYGTPNGAPVVSGQMLATYALALEDGLQTAVIISLFTDSRADRDAQLPLNQTDRRGWVGDEFMDTVQGGQSAQGARADAWGSALWLVYISKVTPDVLERARFAAQEALAWLVQGGIASRVLVQAQWAGPALDRLALRVSIYKPQDLAPVYDVLWGTTLRRLDALAAPVGGGGVSCCDPQVAAAPPSSVLYAVLRYGRFLLPDPEASIYYIPLAWRSKSEPQTRFIKIYPSATSVSDLGNVSDFFLIEIPNEQDGILGPMTGSVAAQLPIGFSCYLTDSGELVLTREAMGFAVDVGYRGPIEGLNNFDHRGLWWALYEDTDNNTDFDYQAPGAAFESTADGSFAYFSPINRLPNSLGNIPN